MVKSTKKRITAAAAAAAAKRARKVDLVSPVVPLTQPAPGYATPPRIHRPDAAALLSPSPVAENPSVESDNALRDTLLSSATTTAKEFMERRKLQTQDKPGFSLTDFGIISDVTGGGSGAGQDKLSHVLIGLVTNEAIVIRIEPTDQSACAWAEKVFMDDVKVGVTYVKEANISNYVHKLYLQNEAVLNPRGFEKRCFVIPVKNTDIPQEALHAIAVHVATNLTGNKKNKLQVAVPDDFIWTRGATWVEVIGSEAARSRLLRKTGGAFGNGYYEQNTAAIHQHFPSGKMTMDDACALYAPLNQVHPDELKAATLSAENDAGLFDDDEEIPEPADGARMDEGDARDDPDVLDLDNAGSDVDDADSDEDED